MRKMNLSAIAKSFQAVYQKHGPEILTGIGIAGMITTTVLAVKSTPKALMLIEEKKLDLDTEKLGAFETIRTTWTCYIPPVVTGIMSIGCLVGASSVNVRRNAALAAAYALSESTLKEYKDKVVEVVGEKKEQAVRDSIAKDKIEKNPVEANQVIITEKGDTLCYEPLSGRYFKSDIDKIKRAVNEVNRMLLGDAHISLNDFYDEVGLDDTRIGDDIGWDISRGLVEVGFSSQLTSDGTPCVVIDFVTPPSYDYDRII